MGKTIAAKHIPLQVSSDAFYQDLMNFDDPLCQMNVMDALEKDCLTILRQKQLAHSGDTVDTLSSDAGDLLSTTILAFFKYIPTYCSDPAYADGSHREASLRYIFNCRLNDLRRARKRHSDHFAFSLDDPVGDDGATKGDFVGADPTSNPEDILESRLGLTEDDLIWKVLSVYCSINTDPGNLIGYLYKTFCSGDSATVVREDAKSRSGAVKKTVADLSGRTYLDALTYTHHMIEAALHCRIPKDCFALLYGRMEMPDKNGVLYRDKIFDLSVRTITERGSWIDSKADPALQSLTGRSKKKPKDDPDDPDKAD